MESPLHKGILFLKFLFFHLIGIFQKFQPYKEKKLAQGGVDLQKMQYPKQKGLMNKSFLE